MWNKKYAEINFLILKIFIENKQLLALINILILTLNVKTSKLNL